jgi:hypothetical protein
MHDRALTDDSGIDCITPDLYQSTIFIATYRFELNDIDEKPQCSEGDPQRQLTLSDRYGFHLLEAPPADFDL